MTTHGWIGLGVAMTLIGCARHETARSEPALHAAASAPRAADMQETDDWCPVHAPGTAVATVEVEGGVAFDFTSTDDVTELRRRVQSMAERQNYGPGHGMGMGMGFRESRGNWRMGSHGMMGHGNMMGRGSMMGRGMNAAASVEDVEGGARLTFRPDNLAELDVLRERAWAWGAQMGRGECQTMWSDAQDEAPQESTEPPESTEPAESTEPPESTEPAER